MKWAVGITTYNRPDVLELTLSQFDKFGGDIIVIDDHSDKKPSKRCIRNTERLGIAKSKNKCINLLKDYDRIFLFDDDCFPIKDKWWEIYGDGHHYVHADFPPHYVAKYVGNDAWWTGAMGCSMMIDQEVIKKTGGMDERFLVYGFEHVEYTQRIFKLGLTPYPYITPKNLGDYIWSLDSRGGFDGFGHNGKHWVGSVFSDSEKDIHVRRNQELFGKLSNDLSFRRYDNQSR